MDTGRGEAVPDSRDDKSVHIHFLDYDTFRCPVTLAQISAAIGATPNAGDPGSRVNVLSHRLAMDLKSLSVYTDGLFLTWGGEKEHATLHKTFSKLQGDKNVTDFSTGRSVVLPVSSLDSQNASAVRKEGSLPRQHASQNAGQSLVQQFEKFITRDRDYLESVPQRSDRIPVVCVLMNGGEQSLKAACMAVRNHIPVIIMKGSGGFADILAAVFEGGTFHPSRHRIEGQVVSRNVRVVDQDKMKEIRCRLQQNDSVVLDYLDQLSRRLHLLTVYNPADKSSRNLDAVVVEALIKHDQEDRFRYLIRSMKRQQVNVDFPARVFSESLAVTQRLQLDTFIEVLLEQAPAAVSAFLELMELMSSSDFPFGRRLQLKSMSDFHFARVLRLYSQDVRFLEKAWPQKDGENLYEKFVQARKQLKAYVGKVAVYPLKCRGSKCTFCNVKMSGQNVTMETARDLFLQTCLHPIQEMFLWSLLAGNIDLAMAFWRYCDDKMAAALFARAVFLGIAKTQKEVNVKNDLEDYASRFENLAEGTLQAAWEMDEIKTLQLLTKKCPWWGDLPLMEIAILTKCKAFIAKEVFQKRLTHEWKGNCQNEAKKSSVKKDQDTRKCKKFCTKNIHPIVRFWICLLWQVAFFLLYSYMLLFETSQSITPVFIILCVWVADIFAEEMRQMLKPNFKIHASSKKLLTKFKIYINQKWNWLDLFSILLFVLGSVLLTLSCSECRTIGRVLLAIDVCAFVFRFLQILHVYPSIGLLLVMAQKMFKDCFLFMVILMTILVGYTVTSESLAQPARTFTLDRLFQLPSTAFWQIFAELGNDEPSEKEDKGHADVNSNATMPGHEPEPELTMSERYLVPITLGIYLVITHVLLLNLLIARFNVTIKEVKKDAEQHQAWQRCQLVREYQNRSFLPPPFNMLFCAIALVAYCCPCLWRSCCWRHPTVGHDHRSRGGWSCVCFMELHSVDDKQGPLFDCPADGKCVTITWTDSADRCKVKTLNNNNIAQSSDTYRVVKGNQRLIVWRADPSFSVQVSLDQNITREETTWEQQQYRNFCHELQMFETEQASWVIDEMMSMDNMYTSRLIHSSRLLYGEGHLANREQDTPGYYGTLNRKSRSLQSLLR